MCLLKLRFSHGSCLAVGFLGHMIDVFPVFFLRNLHIVSMVAISVYILTNSVGGFSFLYILSSSSCPLSEVWSRSLSLSTQPPLAVTGMQTASWPGSAGWHWFLCRILFTVFHPLVAVLPSEILKWTSSPLVMGFPSVWKIFILHNSFPDVQDSFCFLCLFIFLLPFPYHFMWSLACLFGSLRSTASI